MSTCAAARHGTSLAYREDRCRCPEARHQQFREIKRYRLRVLSGETLTVDPTGTRRRLQALMVNGWSQTEIGRRIGVSNAQVSLWLCRSTWLLPRTAQRVHAVYEELRDTRGPSNVAAGKGRAKGWLGPQWWDDWNIDDPRYDPVLESAVTAAELDAQEQAHRLLQVWRLTDAGVGAKEIGRRIGVTGRTVVRYRAAWAVAS